MRVSGGCLFAYFFGYPLSQGIDDVLNSSYRLIRFIPVPMLRLMVGAQVLMCLYVKGDGYKANRVLELVRPNLRNKNIAPFFRLFAYVAVLMHELTESPEIVKATSNEALALAKETGIHRFDHMLRMHVIIANMNKGKIHAAQELIHEIANKYPPQITMDIGTFSGTCGLLEAMSGNNLTAKDYFSDAVDSMHDIGHRLIYSSMLNAKVEVLAELNEIEKNPEFTCLNWKY